MYYKISSIILNTDKKNSNASDLYIAQPDEHKEELAGKLFIMIEIESKKSSALKIQNFLIGNINYNYYQNENILLREKVKSIKTEDILEDSLSKTNKDFVEFLNKEKIKISPYAINITVGVLHQNLLHFSSVGKNKNLVIFKINDSKKNNSKIEHKVIDIGHSKEKKIQTVSLLKFFTDIASGEIPKEGYYFLANEALSEYLSNKQIVDIFTKLPPISAATYIENLLNKINLNVIFLGIIIKSTLQAPTEDEINEENYKKSVIFDLDTAGKETEKILKPSGVISFKKIFSYIKNISEKISILMLPKNVLEIKQESQLFKKNSLKEKIFFKKRAHLFSFKKIFNILRFITIKVYSFIIWFLKLITNKERIMEESSKIKKIFILFMDKIIIFINLLKKLSLVNKIILGIIPLLIGGFILITHNTFVKNEQKQNIIAIENSIANIQKIQNQIDGKLLYNNEKEAKDLINANNINLNHLKTVIDTTNQNNQLTVYSALKNKQAEQLQKLQHVVNIENIDKLTNFTDLNKDAKTINLIVNKNYIYGADIKNTSIYQFEENSKFATIIKNKDLKIKELQFPIAIDDNIFYFNDGEIVAVNSRTRTITKSKINLPQASNILSMVKYGKWMYLLDKNNKIHKYTKYGEKFKNRVEWLKEKVDFSKAVDFAIDGEIYVLNNNGSVDKYSQGKKQDFTIDTLINKTTNTTKIQVSPDIQKGFIYILEQDQERLLVFNKNGKFIKQYNNQYFKDADDFFVDEKYQKIYLLNNNIVYTYSVKK